MAFCFFGGSLGCRELHLKRSIVDLIPSGAAVCFPVDLQDDDSSLFAFFIAWFCTEERLPREAGEGIPEALFPRPRHAATNEMLGRATETLFWICRRYAELCLFRRLQSHSNSPPEAVKDQRAYAHLILSVLLVSASPERHQAAAMENKAVYVDFQDRQRRVYNALWVYASITIAKLPAWSNFWQTLPEHLDILSVPDLPKQFQASLSDFNVSVNAISSARLQRLKDFATSFPS
ncbi:hypothetical protein B0H63DRAFT_540380 [Podospora didyma]|uniref:Uncharacterized protein n=1 Tax=Podospora didyma TaxID=330526 RepID=A0AAE0U0M6_9PEZI|nr:hypothetical protein B0H63DRAFT_540380 [Podospora didyma]